MIHNFQNFSRKQIIITAVSFLLVGSLVFYNAIKYKIINKEVGKLVDAESEGLYKIAYDSIAIDEIGGNLTLINVTLTPDTTLQLKLLQAGDTTAQKMLLSVSIPKIEVIGFETATALLSQQLICNSIRIIDPVVTAYLFPSTNKEKAREQPKAELYKQLLGKMKLIYADSVSVINSEVRAIDFFSKERKFHTYGTTVQLHEVRIDSAYYHDKSRTLFSKYIGVLSERVVLGDAGTEATLNDLSFDTNKEQLRFSSLEYDAYKTNGNFKSNIQGVSINSLEWKGAAEYSDLVLGNVVVDKVDIETTTAGEKGGNNTKGKQILTGWIKNFNLGNLKINSFNYFNKQTKPGKKDISIQNSSLLLQNVHLDSTAVLDETLVSKINNLELKNDKVEITSDDKLYKYQLTGLHLITGKKQFKIASVKVIPQLSEKAFAKNAGIQKDWFDLNASNIVCNNINVGKIASGEFYMKEITTGNLLLKIYRDLHYPPDTSSKIGSYPHQLLMKLKAPIKVDKLLLNNVNIYYRENSLIGDSIGVVSFTKGKLSINNVNNVAIQKGETATVDFTTFLLNAIPLKGRFTFLLDQWESGRFNVQTTVLKPFDGKSLNSISIPLSLAKINSGKIKSIDFIIIGDNYKSTGNVKLTYENLKIALLKRKEDGLNRKTVFSLLVNLLVKNNNRKATMREAEIKFERVPNKSIFNFIWQSFFSGAKEILGIKL